MNGNNSSGVLGKSLTNVVFLIFVGLNIWHNKYFCAFIFCVFVFVDRCRPLRECACSKNESSKTPVSSEGVPCSFHSRNPG
jgi:hypothetical protein